MKVFIHGKHSVLPRMWLCGTDPLKFRLTQKIMSGRVMDTSNFTDSKAKNICKDSTNCSQHSQKSIFKGAFKLYKATCYWLFALFVAQSTVMLHPSAFSCVRQLTEMKQNKSLVQFLSYLFLNHLKRQNLVMNQYQPDPVLTDRDQNNKYTNDDKTSEQNNVQQMQKKLATCGFHMAYIPVKIHEVMWQKCKNVNSLVFEKKELTIKHQVSC